MEDRVVEFIRGLRAAGVRVSLSESIDAMQAIGVLGIQDKDIFRESLRATLVKEHDDRPFLKSSSRSTSAAAARRCRMRWKI